MKGATVTFFIFITLLIATAVILVNNFTSFGRYLVIDGGGGGGFDFTISAKPNSGTVVNGNLISTTIYLTQYGDARYVSLYYGGCPSGASCSLSPASCTSSCTSKLTVNAYNTVPGNYYITVYGTGGGITHSTTYSLTVKPALLPDFSISASPTSQSVLQSQRANYTITLTPLNGFNGNILLRFSGCPDICFSGNYGTVDATSALTFKNYNIYATKGSNNAWTRIVIKNATDGNVADSLIISQGIYSYSSLANLDIKVFKVRALADGTVAGVDLSVDSPKYVSGSSSSSILSAYTTLATPTGNYLITANGSSIVGSLTHSTQVYLRVSDFSINMNPVSASVPAGQSTSYAIFLTTLTGFNNSVNLSISGCPTFSFCSFNINPAYIFSGSYGTATATSPVSYGTYSFYSDIGSSGNWARVIVKDSAGNTVESHIINQGEQYDFSLVGLKVYLIIVRALTDGTIVGSDLAVSRIGTIPYSSKLIITTTTNTPKSTYNFSVVGVSGLLSRSRNGALSVT